jgi:hypothetical protein
MVDLLSKYNANTVKSVRTHTTGSSNMEALQATKGLAHDEHTVEKHALPNADTRARPIAQEEGAQNRQRDRATQAWGKIPETPPLSLPQKVSMKRVVFSREVTGRCHTLLDA